MGKQHRRVTSTDVARASGVSRATVSYVLNNDPHQTISPETRERVLNAVAALEYRPFTPARILSSGTSNLILAVLPFELVDPAMARTLKELEIRLTEQGLSLISYVGVRSMSEKTHPSDNLTPAVVLSYAEESDPITVEFLRKFHAPILPMMRNQTSQQAVGELQGTYLARQGKRTIVFAMPERSDVQTLAQTRLEGARQACRALGLADPRVQSIPPTRTEARAVIAHLLSQQAPPFGVCCYNDEVAFAVMAALADASTRIPQDVAVIGCDDITLSQFSLPALTTISFDKEETFDPLIENILAARRGDPIQVLEHTPPFVIVRESA